MKTEPRIDAYISKSADFAQPILKHFRKLIHKACPEVEEKIKWGMPHFDYKSAPMAHMAAFKQHCAIGFWKAALMDDAEKLMGTAKTETAMGHIGKITSMKDLPKDAVLLKYIKNAMKLNEEGAKVERPKAAAKKIAVPGYILKAIAKNKMALHTFNNFPEGQRKEYVLWITEAKSEDTREKRLATAIEWMSEGKRRNWKYEKK